MQYKIKVIDRFKLAIKNRKKLPSKLQTALHGFYIPNDLCGKSNAKTLKGEAENITTYVMYLAPHKQNSKGVNLCTNASKGCIDACLFTSGRGRFGSVKYARINKTDYYLKDKKMFMYQLEREIQKYVDRHAKDNSKFAIRLNGTSDISFNSVMRKFPNVTFYDYTKNLNRAKNNNVPNYDLTFSRSESNEDQVLEALSLGIRTAIVVSEDLYKTLTFDGKVLIDGDKNDLRFLDANGLVILYAKGDGKTDESGFVINDKNKLKKYVDVVTNAKVIA
tara:strand:- start:567 stop:1397 length:831 start_codon:yes stop_codon:yes gene_type:complete